MNASIIIPENHNTPGWICTILLFIVLLEIVNEIAYDIRKRERVNIKARGGWTLLLCLGSVVIVRPNRNWGSYRWLPDVTYSYTLFTFLVDNFRLIVWWMGRLIHPFSRGWVFDSKLTNFGSRFSNWAALKSSTIVRNKETDLFISTCFSVRKKSYKVR